MTSSQDLPRSKLLAWACHARFPWLIALLTGQSTRSRLLRIGQRTALGLFLICLLAVAFFQGMVHFTTYRGRPTTLNPPSILIQDRHGQPMAAFVSSDDQWRLPLTLQEMGPHLPRAIMAVEDARFMDHAGVDWSSMAMAVVENITHAGIHRGASTLTMQLDRLRSGTPHSMTGKFWQMVGAEQLEQSLTKDQILTEYLNAAPFGGNLVGAGAASWRFFGKPPSQLSLAQAALLAGLPQNPNRYRPDRFPQAALARRQHVLDRMLACGMINQVQWALACQEPVDAQWRSLPQEQRISALPVLLDIAQQHHGGVVQCSLDLSLQQQCDAIGRRFVSQANGSDMAMCIVVLDTTTAQVLASTAVASNPTFIHLANQPRSTGSILKPFIYAAAFADNRCTPQTLLADQPGSWSGYTPGNYDHEFRGNIPAADALAQSRNLPALNMLNLIGTQRAIQVLSGSGFDTLARSDRNYGLSLAIGGAEATPLETAEAFATLARGGIHRAANWNDPQTPSINPPTLAANNATSMDHIVTFTSNSDATTNPHSAQSRVLPAEACWQTLAALCRPNSALPANWGNNPVGIAWKTGTSSDHRDAWCAAVSMRKTVVVWVGGLQGKGQLQWSGLDTTSPVALSLLATLDPYPVPWPNVAPTSSDLQPAVLMPRPRLSIISPTPGGKYILDDSQAPSKIPLKCTWTSIVQTSDSNSSQTIWWFIDGECVGSAPTGRPLWWTPSAGKHQIRVMDGSDGSAITSITVEKQ